MNIEYYHIILYIFISSLFINLLYWLIIFTKLNYNNILTKSNSSNPGVSIIISGKNEARNLEKLIPLLLNQSYPKFEIVIANDCSTDDSLDILKSYDNEKRLLYVDIKEDLPGKKHALTQAIHTANYEYLLLTDADCLPVSNSWITMMMKARNSKSLVLGYGPMNKTSGWLNNYIRYETFLTAIQYFSYALWNHSYMGVGRNMLYTKSLFANNNEFDNHKHITSGDDDLFVNNISDMQDVSICIDENSFMYSDAKSTFDEYFQQKTRHYSTSTSYKLIDQLSLGLFAASHMILYICLAFLLFSPYWGEALLLYFTRVILIISVNYKSFKILKIEDLILYFPIFDILNFVFNIIFIPSVLFPRKNNW